MFEMVSILFFSIDLNVYGLAFLALDRVISLTFEYRWAQQID